MRQFSLTASTLLAMLCYVQSGKTRAIAYDRDDMAEPLAKKIREAVTDRAGSESVSIEFSEDERELLRQFQGCASNIRMAFKSLTEGFSE